MKFFVLMSVLLLSATVPHSSEASLNHCFSQLLIIVQHHKLSRIKEMILSPKKSEWDQSLKSLLEQTNRKEKDQLLTELHRDSSFALTTPSYQRFVKLFLNDEISWREWIHEIRQYGLRLPLPLLFFEKTIEEMPDQLKEAILQEILKVYRDSKMALQKHAYLDPAQNLGVSELKMLRRKAKWFAPKRIFDLLLHQLTKASTHLSYDLKSGKDVLSSYDLYLKSFKSCEYTATDLKNMALAIQKKMTELSSSNNEVILYGSIPNGLADIKGSFDIDLALSSKELASGNQLVENSFLMSYAGSQAMEEAALQVLKEKYGIKGYDIKSQTDVGHRSISIEKLYGEALDRLSPVLISITPTEINLIVREAVYQRSYLSFYGLDDIKGYSFKNKRPVYVKF